MFALHHYRLHYNIIRGYHILVFVYVSRVLNGDQRFATHIFPGYSPRLIVATPHAVGPFAQEELTADFFVLLGVLHVTQYDVIAVMISPLNVARRASHIYYRTTRDEGGLGTSASDSTNCSQAMNNWCVLIFDMRTMFQPWFGFWVHFHYQGCVSHTSFNYSSFILGMIYVKSLRHYMACWEGWSQQMIDWRSALNFFSRLKLKTSLQQIT